jgi:glucose/arabinose dehydrogenase
MRAICDPSRRVAGAALAAVMLAACSSATLSPSPPTAISSASASAGSSGTSPTASPSPSPSPTPSPTPVPAAVVTPAARPNPTPKPAVGGPNHLVLAPIASGLIGPIGVTNAGDGSGRLFVIQQGGQVRVIDSDGSLRSAPFVDLSGRIKAGGEQGLLGLAFHPNFATNGRLFVDYTRAGDGATVVSELTALAGHGSADPVSEKILLIISQPYANHNGGQIAFGPNGYLYIGMGDGGSGGDPHGNGQNRQVLLGKILRIDVNGTPAPGKAYAIPNANPYAAGGMSPGGGLPEIWAYGLRNPWRFSFDRGTGDLYIGDVGQNAWEEIDRQPAGSRGGLNYGWNAWEGRHCYSAACGTVTAVAPIAEYGHGLGCAVTGGYVYRGARQPALKGIYLFGDYCSGTIFSVPAGGGTPTPKAVAQTGLLISSFGEGEDGEIYLVDLSGGGLYRVVVG